MRLYKWKKLGAKTLIDTPWLNVTQEKVKLANGKVLNDYYLINCKDWVLAIVQNNKKEFLICSLYRHGIRKISNEFVGGMVDSGDTPLSAIKKELREEVGYTGGKFKKLGKLSPNPSNHTNYNHIFYVTGGQITHEQDLDETEEIYFQWVSEKKLKALIRKGDFAHSLHLAALKLLDEI